MTEEELDIVRVKVGQICLAYKVGASECEDIFQDVVLRIIRYRRPINNLHAWVGSCAMNLLRHQHKKRKIFNRNAPILYYPQIANDPERETLQNEMKRVVSAMIDSLTPKQRQAVKRWLEKRSGEKTDNMLGSERISLHRALAACRQKFSKLKFLLD